MKFVSVRVPARIRGNPHMKITEGSSWAGLCDGYGRGDGVWLLRLGHEKHCGFLLAVSFGLLAWKKPDAIFGGLSSSPMETW